MSRDDVKPRPSLLNGGGLWLILNAVIIGATLVVLAAMGVSFTSSFLYSITISWVIYATLAPAMMLVVISGGLDLLTGAVATLAGMIVLQSGLNIWIGVAGAICIALAFGFV